MSVTIVSAVAKTAAPAKAESSIATDAGVVAPDFASLLIDQLAPAIAPLLAQDSDSAKAAPANEEPTASEDTAALLAALGIVAAPTAMADAGQPPLADAVAATAGKSVGVTALSAQEAPGIAAKGLPATETSANTAPASKEAAIIAASTPKTVPEKAETLKSAGEPAAGAPATFSVTAPAGANVAAAQRETASALPTPLRDAHWGGDFAQKVVWLASHDKQFAQLTLNPPQMGPIEISMSVEKGSANASFFSANAEVREAIETALPRLREMFASAGINLGQTNVSAESFKQAQANEYGSSGGTRSRDDNAILVAESAAAQPSRAYGGTRGMVDIFA